MISAKIIADSKNLNGDRITTMEVVMPRMILAEFNTHRMFSRNSASSRAIPFKKMVKMVKQNPFIPIAWMKDHKGMQGSEYFTGKFKKWMMRQLWLLARTFAVIMATALHKNGLTKQICNRILEPFMWHTVLVTATEWENFFALRANSAAEIHMQELANRMLIAYNESNPKLLQPGKWHMPFGDDIDVCLLYEIKSTDNTWSTKVNPTFDFKNDVQYQQWLTVKKLMIATARCARLSYKTLGDNPKIDFGADIKLHDDLCKGGHWSPFEHCAQAMHEAHIESESFNADDGDEGSWGWSGNFKGFIQYRKQFFGENRRDDRVRKIY